MKIKPVFAVEITFLSFVFFLTNLRSTIFWSLYPPVDRILDPGWRETVLWLFAMLIMFYLLGKHSLSRQYLQSWLSQPLLMVFVVFSLLSVFWSTAWNVALHRSLSFLFATAAAVFFGLRYSLEEFLHVLAWVGGLIALSSSMLVIANPELGTQIGTLYQGAWRGIFWHKNQLGNILPIFNIIFLLLIVLSLKWKERPGARWLFVFFYFLSLIDIVFAKSASGYIVTIVLHLSLGTVFLWLRIRQFLRPIHYYMVLAAFVAVSTAILLNLGFIFGLLGKSVSLTGRVPLWGLLLHEVFPLHPWFGQGFGTIWASLDFRLYMQDLVGWRYPILIGDNGFMDILLNLGVVGLIMFMMFYIKAWGNSIQYCLRDLTLTGFFPLIFMIYTFFANITFSLFMEIETMVWMLMVVFTIMVFINQGSGYRDQSRA